MTETSDVTTRKDITHLICIIAVQSVHTGKIEQGRMLARAVGAELSEHEIYELARVWRVNWQVDKARSERSTCFICENPLSPDIEDLCRFCFRKAEVGRFVNPVTPEIITQLIKDYGYGPDLIVETILCKDCNRLSWVTAGVINSRFRAQQKRNETPRYSSPLRCMPCYRANKSAKTPKNQLTANLEEHNERKSLEDLQERVSQDASSIAEG